MKNTSQGKSFLGTNVRNKYSLNLEGQEQDLTLYSQESVNDTVKNLKKNKEEFLSNKFESTLTALSNNENLIRYLKLNHEKGAASW